MVEFLILAAELVVLAVLLVRRNPALFLGKPFLFTVTTIGWITGVLFEAMPFTAVGHGIGWRTVLCGVLGLFAMRLFARLTGLWADGVLRDELAPDEKPHRLTHPLVAFGILLAGVPMTFNVLALRHEALEVESHARDAETGVIEGAEAVTLAPDGETDHAVLLIHGFMGTRTDLGDLPERLRAAGLHVRVMLLPGHGRRPSDLGSVDVDQYLEAVSGELAALAQEHRRVSVVGFSIGGSLAAIAATGARRTPGDDEITVDDPGLHALVLVNPYLGRLWKPDWLPGTTHGWVEGLSLEIPRVMRDERFTRVNRKEGLEGHLAYLTVSLAGVEEIWWLGGLARDVPKKISCPTLMLLSETDRVTPSEHGEAYFGNLTGVPAAEKRLVHYPRSDHILLRDHDRAEALAEIVAWLSGG